MPASPSDTHDTEVVPRSIGRLLDVLELVLAERDRTLTEIATATGLTPTTALRYLRALETRGHVDRDGGGVFSPGPTILRLAAGLRRGFTLDGLAAAAQPHLDALAARTGESAYLAVGDGRIGTYLAAAESPRAIRHVGWVGQDIPLGGSALGAALADAGTIAVRTGAIEPDITAMSLAVRAHGRLGVAVSIVGPAHRFTERSISTHRTALTETVDTIAHTHDASGEDLTR